MNMKRKPNTLDKGVIRHIIFKENGQWYGAALELNIVVEGDDPNQTIYYLDEAVRGYIKSARKVKARPAILNQNAGEYELMWQTLQLRYSQGKSVPAARKLPQEVHTFGFTPLVPA